MVRDGLFIFSMLAFIDQNQHLIATDLPQSSYNCGVAGGKYDAPNYEEDLVSRTFRFLSSH